MNKPCLYGIGVGPGDPELLTLKALRIIRSVDVIAYQSAVGHSSVARSIVESYLNSGQTEVVFHFPKALDPEEGKLAYDHSVELILEHLKLGKSVGVLCEGDPLLYGSFMYIFTRLKDNYPIEVIPGVSSPMAAAAMLGVPLSYRNDVFSIISGTLPQDQLTDQLLRCDACAVIKLSKNFTKVRSVLGELNLLDRAFYIERATMPEQKIIPIGLVDPQNVPYFSMIILPTTSKI